MALAFNKASALKWYNDAGEADNDSAVYSDHKLILFGGFNFKHQCHILKDI